MAARKLAFVALCASAITITRSMQPAARIYLNVPPRSSRTSWAPPVRHDDVERRYTPELMEDLRRTRDTALHLYTEYTSAAGSDLKYFLRNISSLLQDTIKTMENRVLDRASRLCRDDFDRRIKKIEYDSHRAATFSGENHHKYFLGHMVVFRIHLNKSEDYLRRCQQINQGCGIPCETTASAIRWRRLALLEINRVKDDIQHSRRSYEDLLLHSRRKLNHLRRQAQLRTKTAIAAVESCVRCTSC